MTIRNSRDTLTFLALVSYALIYQETMIKLIPLVPIFVILFIFYNYFYEVEFKRPKLTLIKNFKFLQATMSITGDMFEIQYYIIEHFFFWKSKELTLMNLNILLLSFFGALPLYIIPIRYLLVFGLWFTVSLSSPFCVALGQAIL
jgi:hypothetical protein